MRPVFDVASSVSSANVSGTSATWSHTCTGTNLYLVVSFIIVNTTSNLGVTYNGVSMTQLGSVLRGLSTMYFFGLANPATGAHNVVASWTTSRQYVGGSASYSGCAGDDPTATILSSQGTIASDTLSPIPCINDLIIDAAWAYNGNNTTVPTITLSSSQNSRVSQANTLSAAAMRLRQSDLAAEGLTASALAFANTTDWTHMVLYLHGLSSWFLFFRP